MNPTLEQIKTDESAWPEGATHWIGGDFHKYVENKSESGQILNGNHWEDYKPSLEYYEMTGATIIPRPTKAFVPEVGEWCEHMHALGYERSFIIGKNKEGNYVFQNDKGSCYYTDSKEYFRPIKTERELFVEMCKEITDLDGEKPEAVFGKLYDNNCRFMEPTK